MFIHNFTVYPIMNKSILIGVPIAVIVILLGVYFVSSDTDFTEEPISEFEPQNESEPKQWLMDRQIAICE